MEGRRLKDRDKKTGTEKKDNTWRGDDYSHCWQSHCIMSRVVVGGHQFPTCECGFKTKGPYPEIVRDKCRGPSCWAKLQPITARLYIICGDLVNEQNQAVESGGVRSSRDLSGHEESSYISPPSKQPNRPKNTETALQVCNTSRNCFPFYCQVGDWKHCSAESLVIRTNNKQQDKHIK